MPLSRERPPVTARRPLILVTDAWHPQVNGVVHTWSYVQRELDQLALQLPRTEVRTAVIKRSWAEIARDLLSVLVPIEAAGL